MSRRAGLLPVLFAGLAVLVCGCGADSYRAVERQREIEVLDNLNFGPEWIATTTRQSTSELGERTERIYWSSPTAWDRLLARVRSSVVSDPLWELRSSAGGGGDVGSLRAKIDGCELFIDRGLLPREDDLGSATIPANTTGIGMYVSVRCRAATGKA
jgi:hypothetical protein